MAKFTVNSKINTARIIFTAFFASTLLAFTAPGQTPPATYARKLTLGQPIERTIKGGETHSFTFDVKAGHYARAEVEQKNIDIVVSLFAPDGKLLIEIYVNWFRINGRKRCENL